MKVPKMCQIGITVPTTNDGLEHSIKSYYGYAKSSVASSRYLTKYYDLKSQIDIVGESLRTLQRGKTKIPVYTCIKFLNYVNVDFIACILDYC